MTVNVPILYQSSGVTPSKVYYSNTRHSFCITSFKTILQLRKYCKCDTKRACLSVSMAVNMSILYKNSDLTQSVVYYSNTRYQFCMN